MWMVLSALYGLVKTYSLWGIQYACCEVIFLMVVRHLWGPGEVVLLDILWGRHVCVCPCHVSDSICGHDKSAITYSTGEPSVNHL